MLVYIYFYIEYEMFYIKNFVKSEDELDEEVIYFYFLNKYNLLEWK